ncbi:MAG: helix-turn-helix transcriptional regulator [Acidimicrobiales bacterium]
MTTNAPALLSIEDAHRQVGISRSTFKREMAAGRIHVVYVRSRPYVPRTSLEAYIEERMTGRTR